MAKERILILGAAGKDFHVFNMVYRENSDVDVVAFTATQIMGIAGRKYPPVLSGELYPNGIDILDEKELVNIIRERNIDTCIFAYSDVTHDTVMNIASVANANGADFKLLSMDKTMLKTDKPVISITAVRTGVGKSQTSRYITGILKENGLKVVAMRHPMPYGDLSKQVAQRFAEYSDLDKYECTIEEREEYEPYIDQGFVIYSGVDYDKILRMAEKEADVIIWDGGNNDTPFVKPDLHIVLADPHRVGHELMYHPGETNFRSANVIVINKVDSAKAQDVQTVYDNAKQANPEAIILKTESPVTVEDEEAVKGKKVLVIEDGPTITHGSMAFGAGMVAAERLGLEVVDPKPYLVGTIKASFEKYTQLDMALPALGYSAEQLKELEQVIDSVDCDVVLSATPIDITRVIKVNKPIVRVRYASKEVDGTPLADMVKKIISN
ncbi:MAG: Cyclic 2,3-diphosphoglycerate synthetase [Candidatus Heimdallarchaeota archaeon LC_2]|nr:MAG: Cyclic 2,3-diphosphoglycerate synthetase [Candidatus Heimdallarchaeota archaeon LC_2]